MTVGELISKLSGIDPSLDVILSKDAEGNYYSPLTEVDAECIYTPETTYSGYVRSTRWSSDEACMCHEDWEKFKAQKRSVVLWPVN